MELADQAFTLKGNMPPLAFNALRTPSEHSAHSGYAHFVRGIVGAFRNPTAHEPKVEFPISEDDAIDMLATISMVYRRLDAAALTPAYEVLAVMLARRTQTNEPARCATLLPLLATLPQPLALLEVGAAAGLRLLPDRYAYDYGGHRVAPRAPVTHAPPQFSCRASPSTPLPEQGVDVAWRAGLDLEPLDVQDPDQVAWLKTLVWPGEGARLELLRAALEVARADPPRVVRGDLRCDLPALAAQAPSGATLVIFHTAVLAYVDDRPTALRSPTPSAHSMRCGSPTRARASSRRQLRRLPTRARRLDRPARDRHRLAGAAAGVPDAPRRLLTPLPGTA